MSDITNPEATEATEQEGGGTLSLPVAGTFLLHPAEDGNPALVLVLMSDGTVRWVTADADAEAEAAQ